MEKYKNVIYDANIAHKYKKIWKQERLRFRRGLRIKQRKKIKFLKRKYSHKREIPDDIEGINIADKETPPHFITDLKCYGAGEVNEKEKRVLSLPPTFAVYDKVDVFEM